MKLTKYRLINIKKVKKVESELDITNRIIKILEKNDDISKLGAREIRISLDNIRKLLKQNKNG